MLSVHQARCVDRCGYQLGGRQAGVAYAPQLRLAVRLDSTSKGASQRCRRRWVRHIVQSTSDGAPSGQSETVAAGGVDQQQQQQLAVAAAGVLATTQPPKSSAAASIATLTNVAVGAGILSMPYAFSLMGWQLGLTLAVTVAAVESSTLWVLCKYAEETGARSYSALVEEMLGPKAGAALTIIMYVYLLLSCTAYLIIATDCLVPLLAGAFGPEAWWAGRQAVAAAVGLGVLLPLSVPRTLGAISSVSTFKVYAIAFVVGAVVLRSLGVLQGPEYTWEAVHAANWSSQLCVALPILSFGYQCHTAVIDVFDELEDEPSLLPKSASPIDPSGSGGGMSPKLRGMIGVAAGSFGLMAFFYSVMGLFGYFAFPTGVDSNIMNSFPQDDTLMQAARASVGLIVIAAFPVNHVPARSSILELLRQVNGGKELPGSAYTVETVLFCLAATAVALQVTDLGAMFQLAGGTAAAVLIFGIPGALLMKAATRQQEGMEATAGGSPGTAAGGAGWWGSPMFWVGALLEVVTVSSWAVTIRNFLVAAQ